MRYILVSLLLSVIRRFLSLDHDYGTLSMFYLCHSDLTVLRFHRMIKFSLIG